MYIYSWSGRKKKLFRKISVRPSAKLLYIKPQERVKIIDCGLFCLNGVYWESKLSNFRHERTKTYEIRAEWNFYRFFYITGSDRWNRSGFFLFYIYGLENNATPDCTRSAEYFRSWSRMKVLLAISWCLNKIINLIFLSFKNVGKKSKLPNFEADRTNIVEVTPEWSFSQSCILRYEVI